MKFSIKISKTKWNNAVLLLLLTLVVTSCGTFSGSKNILIADSTPRGVKVYNEQDKFLGTTPFFFKAKPTWKREFTFKNKKIVVPFKYKCQTDWGGAVAPDTIITALNPAVGSVFIITDYLSGGLWRCRKPMHPTLDSNDFQLSIRKKRILILPVISSDREVSRKIITFFKKKIFKKYNNEEAILIDNEATKEALFERGLDNYADTHPDNIRREFLNELGEKFNLTHFYYFQTIEKENTIIVKPILFDAFTVHPVKVKYSKSFKLKQKNKSGFNFLKKVISMIDFLPNSIIMGYSYNPTENREVNLDPSQTLVEARTNSHPDAFPRLITLLLLDTAHHPRFYDSWDFSGFLSPRFGASSWKSAYSVSGLDYEFLFSSYFAIYDASASIFTPFGEFNFAFGVGIMHYSAEDNQTFNNSKIASLSHFGVSYTTFIGSRTYIKLSVDTYIAPDKEEEQIKTDYYKLTSWKEIRFGIGYYFPEIKALTRKLLPF
jgi:hypothetical protein